MTTLVQASVTARRTASRVRRSTSGASSWASTQWRARGTLAGVAEYVRFRLVRVAVSRRAVAMPPGVGVRRCQCVTPGAAREPQVSGDPGGRRDGQERAGVELRLGEVDQLEVGGAGVVAEQAEGGFLVDAPELFAARARLVVDDVGEHATPGGFADEGGVLDVE